MSNGRLKSSGSAEILQKFTLKEASVHSGIKIEQLRYILSHLRRKQLLLPTEDRGRLYFTLSDLSVFTMFKQLKDQGIGPAEITDRLARIKNQNTAKFKSLSQVSLDASSGKLVYKDGIFNEDPRTGNAFLDFERPVQKSSTNRPIQFKPKKLSQAIPLSDDVIKFDSLEHFNYGIVLEDEAEWAEAMRHYTWAIQKDSSNVDAYLNLGRLYQVIENDFRKAKLCYGEILKADERHQAANFNIGTIFDELQEYDVAVKYYTKAPDLADAHFNLHCIYMQWGDTQKMREHYVRYQELTPTSD